MSLPQPPPQPPPPPPPVQSLSEHPNILSPMHHQHITAFHLLPPLVATTVTLSLLFLFLFLYRRLSHLIRHLPDAKPHLSSSSYSSPSLPRRFSYSTLRRATAGFSPSRRLGQGGFGVVFAGNLTLNSHSKFPVAVKLLDSGYLQGEREFHNEIILTNKLVDSDRIVKLLGFSSSRKKRRLCLVYELMANGNLQDCLLHKKCEELMEWTNRFRIAVEVAQGLAYLHHQCDPPVIHGDIKPSNILLDDNFSAKIGDFGLARLKLVDNDTNHVVVNIGEIKVNHGNYNGAGVEDNGSVMETESVTTTVGFEEGNVGVDHSPDRMIFAVETSPEMVTAPASPLEFLDKDSNMEVQSDIGQDVTKVGNGNEEWGQKQVIEGGSKPGKVKDYVIEWIGAEVDKQRPFSSWLSAALSDAAPEKAEKEKGKKELRWWVSIIGGRLTKKEKRREAKEWWKEEYCEELAMKMMKNKKRQGEMDNNEEHRWPRDDGNKIRSGSSRSDVNWCFDGLSGDLKKAQAHLASYDTMSGEIPKSGGISSTPSTRGTVCYIAPEYSAGGDLSEKCDVYSFGVLLLVVIAGRRPLQVTDSPMSEFHRANLLSWTRQLARTGKLLDLVDEKIHSLNREQARLCIIVALLCLQKSPARRPSMKEVVGMLIGELDPPQLPVEYSPYRFKSRKKLW